MFSVLSSGKTDGRSSKNKIKWRTHLFGKVHENRDQIQYVFGKTKGNIHKVNLQVHIHPHHLNPPSREAGVVKTSTAPSNRHSPSPPVSSPAGGGRQRQSGGERETKSSCRDLLAVKPRPITFRTRFLVRGLPLTYLKEGEENVILIHSQWSS